MRTFPYRTTFGLFAALALSFIWLLSLDFRPPPIFPNAAGDLATPINLEAFDNGDWIEVEFEAQKARLKEIDWEQMLWDERHRLEVKVENLTRQKLIHHGIAKKGQDSLFEPQNLRGDRIRLSYRWVKEKPPKLYFAPQDPQADPSEKSGNVPFVFLSTIKEFDLPKSPNTKRFELESNKPFVFEIAAPETNLRGIYLPDLLQDEISNVRLEIKNLTTGKVLKKSSINPGESSARTWTPSNSKGDLLRFSLLWKPSKGPLARRTTDPPLVDIKQSANGAPVEYVPVFVVHYAWPTRGLLWAWPLVALFGFYAYYRERLAPWFLITLSLMIVATSLDYWQTSYTLFYPHHDPDQYGIYGEWLSEYVLFSRDRDEIELQMRDYTHGYVATVPAFLAVLRLVGIPQDVAYAFLVAISSFGVILLFWHWCRVFQLSYGLTLTATFAFASHFVILKAFAAPSTDMPGLAAVCAMISLLLWRLREENQRQVWMAAVLGILLVMVRPPGPLYLFYFGCAFVIVDWVREGQFRFTKRLATGFAVAGPPTLIFFTLFIVFGWDHNLGAAMKKREEYSPLSTLSNFLHCLPGLLQLAPLGWAAIRWRGTFERRAVILMVSWLIFFPTLLTITQAPFMLRILLPVLPVIVFLGILGLRRLEEKMPIANRILVMLITVANIGLAIWMVCDDHFANQPLANFLY